MLSSKLDFGLIISPPIYSLVNYDFYPNKNHRESFFYAFSIVPYTFTFVQSTKLLLALPCDLMYFNSMSHDPFYNSHITLLPQYSYYARYYIQNTMHKEVLHKNYEFICVMFKFIPEITNALQSHNKAWAVLNIHSNFTNQFISNLIIQNNYTIYE